MKSKKHLISQVIQKRRRGFSIGDISKTMRLSKSTVSIWCKNVVMNTSARKNIHDNWIIRTKNGRVKGTESNKQKKLLRIQNEYSVAKDMIGTISHRDVLMVCMALYWAEGSKKETGTGFNFINSDQHMIFLIYRWLTRTMNISKEVIRLNLAINQQHRNRETEILKFWSNLLDFPLDNFTKTTFIKTPYRRTYTNHSSYFGMIRIRVLKSAWLRRRILGMIHTYNKNLPA